jgi:transcription elongation GreA/GreB family factor
VSRAFTKEDDAGDDLPERPVPSGPNYVTPAGLAALKDAAQALVRRRIHAAASGGDLKPIDRDLRYVEARINSAIPVPPGSGPEVRFGAQVVLRDQEGRLETFRIVGQDEARSGPPLLAWSSPLAQAMIGAKAGGAVTWSGPPPFRRTVVSVEYPSE